MRKKVDTLRGKQWYTFLEKQSTEEKIQWLAQIGMIWQRKQLAKVATTETFYHLRQLFNSFSCLSCLGKELPLCLVPSRQRKTLAEALIVLYGPSLASSFITWVSLSDTPLLVIWITGFKPQGEDSRPDRGLVPLARMLLGNDIHILTLVFGPAKPAMWLKFQQHPQQLAKKNGLWEAIIHLSDAILVDSTTASVNPMSLIIKHKQNKTPQLLDGIASEKGGFSEHDVDSILHFLFHNHEEMGLFEAMCNPPGGDWSGLSIIHFTTFEEFRWVSLPRVSISGTKRPDHIVEFLFENNQVGILSVESKDDTRKIERDIGIKLTNYTRTLLQTPPTVVRSPDGNWTAYHESPHPLANIQYFSGAAFLWKNLNELEKAFERGKVDIIIGIDMQLQQQPTLLHIKTTILGELLLPNILKVVQGLYGRVKIHVY